MNRVKNKRGLLLSIMLILISVLLLFSACVDKEGDSTPSGTTLTKLTAPTVTLTGDIASWEEEDLADKFEISLDGNLSFIENSVTSKQLEDGQTFKIRAIGDGISYSNSDWSNSVTYTQEAPPETDEAFTVIWKNGDTVLETDRDVAYGSTPVYNGAEPTKAATAQYSYTFKGWSPTISSVKGDVTYTAQFSETVNRYTVTFYNEAGTGVLDSVTVNYGQNAEYSKSTPIKNATEGYTYLFDKWVTEQGGSVADDLTNVTSDRAVYASFKEFVRKISVYVLSNNTDYGTVSVSVLENVPYGSAIVVNENTITVNGQTVTAQAHSSSAQYAYTFINWTADATVGSDTIITANFSRSINKYTITWKNGDSVLEVDENVSYGTTPVYNGAEPTKPADNENIYTFSGWSPAVLTVTEDATYVAQFTNAVNKHTVIFYDEDGSVELGRDIVGHGESAEYPNALPTKAATAQYTYTFDKWVTELGGETEATLTNIIANTQVYAKYTSALREYKVTFKDYLGATIKEETVKYGESATMPEIVEERDGYRFSGWDKSLENITQDTVIMATYVAIVRVEFVDYDGTVLYFGEIDKGSDFTEIPSDPTRAYYAFIGWSITDFTNLNEDIVVNALYIRTYEVKFLDYDGTLLKKETVQSGSSATAPTEPTRLEYKFVSWSEDFSVVTSDLTVVAQYKIKTYIVNFIVDGKVVKSEEVKHGFSATPPQIAEARIDLNERKGYKFTKWDTSYERITDNVDISAVYDQEITEPIIIVESVTTETGTVDVPLKITICYSKEFYGLSMDVEFNTKLNAQGISVDVNHAFGEEPSDDEKNFSGGYTSRLTDEGKYELRYIAAGNSGVDLTANKLMDIVVFNFKLDNYQSAGEFVVSVLESSYLIDENLTKIKPVIISGGVTVE